MHNEKTLNTTRTLGKPVAFALVTLTTVGCASMQGPSIQQINAEIASLTASEERMEQRHTTSITLSAYASDNPRYEEQWLQIEKGLLDFTLHNCGSPISVQIGLLRSNSPLQEVQESISLGKQIETFFEAQDCSATVHFNPRQKVNTLLIKRANPTQNGQSA